MRFSEVLLINMLAAASMLLTSKWKSVDMPSMDDRLSKVYMALISKLSAICAYRMGQESALVKFNVQWKPFLLFAHAGYQTTKVWDCILSVL